jgi:hypothetical protein
VIGFIPSEIRVCLPQLPKSVSGLCLVYEADSNRGWWETTGACSNNFARLGIL